MTSPVKNSNIFRNFVFSFNFDVIECHGWWLAAAVTQNHGMPLYKVKHTVCFLGFFAFCEGLFAKNYSFTSFKSLLTILKCFYILIRIRKLL